MISVIVVDDHELVRDGLAALLGSSEDIDVVGVGVDGADAISLCESLRPDIALIDLSMPGTDGIEATLAITRDGPTKVVILSAFSDLTRVREALGAGAFGFLLKDQPVSELIEGITAAAGGIAPFHPRVTRALADERAPTDAPHLSSREEQVLRLVATGASNREISAGLGIAEKTVKAHLTRIFAALAVHSRTAAAIRGKELGY